MRKYGLPYMGSKTRLAEAIVRLIPDTPHLYDIFCGGGAVADCASRSGRFKVVHVNDLLKNQSLAVKQLIDGTLEVSKRWVGREEFYAKRETDPLIRCCWSFGNDGGSYLYAREIEPWKKAVYYARALHDTSLLKEMGIDHEPITRKWITDNMELCRDKYIAWVKPRLGITPDIEKEMAELKKAGKVDLSLGGICGIQHADAEIRRCSDNADKLHSLLLLERMANFQGLQSLESLERVQALERLYDIQKRKGREIKVTATEGDYRSLTFEKESVIYADPPYGSTRQYRLAGAFDSDSFFQWAREQVPLVLISSYTAPEDFVTVASFSHKSTISDAVVYDVQEKVFLFKEREKEYREKTGLSACVTDLDGQLNLF